MGQDKLWIQHRERHESENPGHKHNLSDLENNQDIVAKLFNQKQFKFGIILDKGKNDNVNVS